MNNKCSFPFFKLGIILSKTESFQNAVLEYLSLTLVCSFFLFHNIVLVLFGILIALFFTNKDLISSFINSNIFNKLTYKNISFENSLQQEYKKNKSNKEDSKISLVERIEELGCIPSAERNHDNNIA